MEIDVLARTTPSRLHERLSTQSFSIVHFIGHGTFNDKTQEGALLFEDDHGGQIALGERSIREVFCQRGISLVFMNSCQSGSGGKSDFNKGIAQSLVAHGMPALVANQYSVLDSSATSFAKHFYWSLAHGMSVSQAACEARIAVNYTMQGELIDWAVPVVYARDPNMTLSVKPDTVVESKSTTIQGTNRDEIESRSTQVAVWDIDDQFPALERTLKRMNRVQSVYGFELANLSTPIDAWDYETPAEDGTPYLWAEKLVHRLQHSVVELRVNILACITRHWLRDDDWLNLYGWWPEDKTPPVLIFSTAGFDLAPESLETDRALANVTVSGLAGFFGEMETHLQGAKDCPLGFDQQRDPAVLTGRQVFDQACRKKLEQKIPAMLPALNALLKTFH